LVAGTAVAVGLAVLNEQVRAANSRRLSPAMADAAPSALAHAPSTHGAIHASREAITRRMGHATLIGLAVVVAATIIPAAAALASGLRSSSSAQLPLQGPSDQLRAASSAGIGWEEAYAAAVPSASDRGAALVAGAVEQRKIDTLVALDAWAKREEAAKNQVAGAVAAPVRGTPATLNRASGYAPGTVLRARITIYGCVGRGGGFCGGMASGMKVFDGAAACSSDMPFGTKFTIAGDPTGRTYECLDRGMLAAPWVDVFFYDLEEGFAWASALGSTYANITIVN
jgi:hypothetical protein